MIERMNVCIWSGVTHSSEDHDDPPWESVAEAIRRLNNADRNDVYLQPRRDDPETYLCIGGGNGKYVLTGSVNNETFPTLVVGGVDAEPQVCLVVGGQEGRYPANWVVDIDVALAAARSFWENAAFQPDLNWQDV